jgi:SARP family transcriptional regulator, regulator of embCAB operon
MRDLEWEYQKDGTSVVDPAGSARGRGDWGPTMATHRGEQHALYRPRIDDGHTMSARTRLTEAVTELRRLTQNPSFQSVERLLADLDDAPSGSGAGIQAVRALRQWGDEHLRVADELQAAAHCCRLVEREIDQRIDAFLAVWEGRLETTRTHESGASADTRRRNSLDGWLRELFHRGRTGQERPGYRIVSASRTRGPLPLPLSAAPLRWLPASIVPAADIAALVLGPLELSVAGWRVLRWDSLKARAVFQYLLIHQGRPVRREELMELQWPDHTHNSARNNLNVTLYSLRNTLDGRGQGVQPILYKAGCYSLNPELTWWIDRTEFLSTLHHAELARRADRPQQAIDAYEKAIQLYRGPLFEDDSAGEWFLPEQRHLKDLYLQTLEHLAAVYFELGELSEAVQFGQLAVRSDRCCESMHRLLMRCFASQHQRELVSRQYHSCVAALSDELDIPPAEETVQLFRNLSLDPPCK